MTTLHHHRAFPRVEPLAFRGRLPAMCEEMKSKTNSHEKQPKRMSLQGTTTEFHKNIILNKKIAIQTIATIRVMIHTKKAHDLHLVNDRSSL